MGAVRGDRDSMARAGRRSRDGVREWRRLIAEAVGTFTLTAVAAGPDVVSAALHIPVNEPLKAAAPGLTVAVLIYTLGDISGAHVNPVVTIAFALRRAFPWRRVPGYLVAQLVGALAEFPALTLKAFRLGGRPEGATELHTCYGVAFVVEVLLTCFLVAVILQAATRESLVGPEAAIPVGFTIVVAG